MRFPSIAQLVDRARVVLARFPWTLAAGAVGAITAIQANAPGADSDWERLAFVVALSIPLTIGISLLGEERRWAANHRVAAQLAGLLGLALFYWIWPGMRADVDAMRYFQLSAILHLGVAILPFLRGREGAGFWQYNNLLFTGALRAGLFAQVLFVGLAIALASLEQLFGVDLPDRTYINVMFSVGFVVMTWIFLASMPDDVTALDDAVTYPRPLKVFAQYILTPLALGYLLILVAYLVKILIIAEWPSGWIGWLVASVSVTGILGFLLVHPLRAMRDEGWIRIYARWLFLGLIPAAIMLLVAFWKRIMPYGFTEPRVLGLLLGLWLLGIAIYFSTRRDAGIRSIPVSLALLLAITLFGPLSLTRVSVNSQRDRLIAMLALPNDSELRAPEASGALRFLIQRRDTTAIRKALGEGVTSNLTEMYWLSRGDSLAAELLAPHGVEYRPSYLAADPSDAGYFSRHQPGAMDVAGFGWVIPVDGNDSTVRATGPFVVQVIPATDGLTTLIVVGVDSLRFDLAPFAQQALAAMPRWTRIPPTEGRIASVEGRSGALLVIGAMSAKGAGDSLRVSAWTGHLLLPPQP